MNSTTTTLLAAALLAASSAFGGINVNFEITDAGKTRVVTEFRYGQADPLDGLNGTGNWFLLGNDNGTQTGQSELTQASIGRNDNITVGRMLTSPPLTSLSATHVQLTFSISAGTTLGNWEVNLADLFGNEAGRDINETFEITSAHAGSQLVWTGALTESITGVTANGDGSFNLTNFGSNNLAVTLLNRTNSTANIGVTFEELRFVTGREIVPEPATYGLIFGGFIFTYILIRRRKTRR